MSIQKQAIPTCGLTDKHSSTGSRTNDTLTKVEYLDRTNIYKVVLEKSNPNPKDVNFCRHTSSNAPIPLPIDIILFTGSQKMELTRETFQAKR